MSFLENLYIYVVNHPGKLDTVEKFVFDESRNILQYLNTFSEPSMHRYNNFHHDFSIVVCNYFNFIRGKCTVALTRLVIFSMNDLHVIAEDKFYYTNFLYSYFLPLALLEFLTPVKMGSVGFFDGSEGRILVTPLAAPNGINRSPDHK